MDISTSLSLFPPFCHFTYFCFFLSWVSFCCSLSEGWDDVIYICKISPLLLILYSLHWIAITSDFFDQSVVCKFHFEVSLGLKDSPGYPSLLTKNYTNQNTIRHAVLWLYSRYWRLFPGEQESRVKGCQCKWSNSWHVRFVGFCLGGTSHAPQKFINQRVLVSPVWPAWLADILSVSQSAS